MSTLCPSFNTLECKGNYSATSNNASVVVLMCPLNLASFLPLHKGLCLQLICSVVGEVKTSVKLSGVQGIQSISCW